MTPRPNSFPLGEGEAPEELIHPISLNTVQKIKDFLQDQISYVTLKPYDNSPKDWEAVVRDRYNINEKIQKFEERIRHLNEENNAATAVLRVRRDCNGLCVDASVAVDKGDGDFAHENGQSDVELEVKSKSNINNGNGSLQNGGLKWKSEDVSQSHKTDQKINTFLKVYLHVCAIYAVYLLLSGQYNSQKTILWAFLSLIISCGIRFLFNQSIVIRNRPWRVLVSLVNPMMIEHSEKHVREGCAENTRAISISDYENALVSSESTSHGYSTSTSPVKYEAQRRYLPMKTLLTILMVPVWTIFVPWLFWTETLLTSFMIVGQLQNCISLYIISTIRSYYPSSDFNKEETLRM